MVTEMKGELDLLMWLNGLVLANGTRHVMTLKS